MNIRVSRSKLVLLATALAVLVVGFLVWNSPERRIRAAISEGKAAIESKDLAGAMSHVSLHYQDPLGLNYGGVRMVLTRSFALFEKMAVRLDRMQVDVDDDRAAVHADLSIIVTTGGQKAYLIGGRDEPVPITIRFIKERIRWQVRSVEGIRWPGLDF